MAYDLVIKNGVVIDGSGLPRFRADVGVKGGRIASIGRIRESAKETLDAEGHVVAPGIIDGHTHMDAQIFWDPLGTCSCWHGVTTVPKAAPMTMPTARSRTLPRSRNVLNSCSIGPLQGRPESMRRAVYAQ